MSNSDDSRYYGILLEEIRDQNKAVLEAVSDMQAKVARIPIVEDKVDRLEQDMQVIKAAVTDLSHQVAGHDQQLHQLRPLKAA